MHPFLQAFQAQQGDQSILGALLPFVLIAVVFYFLFFRPQAKQQKQHQAFLQALKKGDEVVTQGGLIGEVIAIDDKVVTLRIEDGKARVLKGNVAGAWKEGAGAAPAPEKK